MTKRNDYIKVFSSVLVLALALTPSMSTLAQEKERTSRITDDSVTELDIENYPERPVPIIEWGNKFLAPGDIKEGIEIPGGAVWQPAFMVFGTARTALQTFDSRGSETTEWVSRLDLYANLQLTGSERILLGIRPLDQEGRFTSYDFDPEDNQEWQEEYNSDITTLFFEGEFAELFPNLDKDDTKSHDIGFAIGRQPLNYQAGMLINDSIDAIGITRNTLLPSGGSDMQITFIYGWNEIHRNNNREEQDSHLFGLFVAMDRPSTTLNFDLVYIDDKKGDTDGVFWGVSDVRRVGHYNLSSRILGSHALEKESNVVGDGYLAFAELSWTPAWTDDNVYINAFVGFDDFSSASRGPANGGPLGRTGILFAAIGLGEYGAPLNNNARDSYGFAWGYQQFINPIKNQFIYELGYKKDTEGTQEQSIAGAIRYRHVVSQQMVFQFDIFKTFNDVEKNAQGARLELRLEF